MDGVLHFMKSLSFAKNYNVWSKSISKLVDELKSVRTSNIQRASILSTLEPYILVERFQNTKEDEIKQSKLDLLRLWEFLLGYTEVVGDKQMKHKSFEFTVIIMERREFSLKQMTNKSIIQKYNRLLLQTSLKLLKSKDKKDLYSEMIQWNARALAVFFFRLPVIGGRLVDALQRKRNEFMKQDQEEKVNPNNEEEGVMDSKCSGSAIDTESQNHDYLVTRIPSKEYPSSKSSVGICLELRLKYQKGTDFIKNNPDIFLWNSLNSAEMISILDEYLIKGENQVLIKFLQNENFFLMFVEYFVLYIENFSDGEVHWSVIPAYSLIVECFLPLQKSALWWDGIARRQLDAGVGWVTSAQAYSRAKMTMIALLRSNTGLLNKYLFNLYTSTNLYSLWSVDSCVEHLILFFDIVSQSSQRTNQRYILPENFDFQYFWYGLEKMLDSDLFQIVLKAASLLYNTLDDFEGQYRVDLVTNVMSHFFFKLFLHWCTEVRTYFHLLLVYKILRTDRRNLPCFTDTKVINDYLGDEGKRKSSYNSTAFSLDSQSFERRMAIFDYSSSQDNEQLLIDIMLCSKIDAFVKSCMDGDPAIPEKYRPYIRPALESYARILWKYYTGSIKEKTYESLALLASRVIESPSNPYLN